MGKAVHASVASDLVVVGTIEPVNNAAASFQVAGQVASVTVVPGAQVTAGETLATLDTTALSESLSSAELSLQSDDAKLTEDEDSETSTAAVATTTTTTPKASTSTPSPAVRPPAELDQPRPIHVGRRSSHVLCRPAKRSSGPGAGEDGMRDRDDGHLDDHDDDHDHHDHPLLPHHPVLPHHPRGQCVHDCTPAGLDRSTVSGHRSADSGFR